MKKQQKRLWPSKFSFCTTDFFHYYNPGMPAGGKGNIFLMNAEFCQF